MIHLPAAPGSARRREATIRLPLPVDLPTTLAALRRGPGDPTCGLDAEGSWWRATRTPEGPAATRLRQVGPRLVRVTAWGPGAGWAIESAPELLGKEDSLDGFDPGPGLVRELHRRHPGLRVTRSKAVFETLVPSILEQKVTGFEARTAYRGLVRAWGEPAPGPRPLFVPPAAEDLRARPYFEFHAFGVERRRATCISRAARVAGRLEETSHLSPGAARTRLTAVPGVGPWTAAEVAIVALGDADAVSVGDFHLPHLVSWALEGRPRGSDERMLELLEPYRGHRGRVLRLLVLSGIRAPRFGPRRRIREIRAL